MKNIHLMHTILPGLHGLNGYKEVIDTVKWGLEQSGYEVSYAVNTFKTNTTNIIFGAQVLPIEYMNTFPEDTIIYNFEQIKGRPPSDICPELHFCAKRFQVWDYSPENLPAWASLGNTNVKIVPVGYAPVLTWIPKLPQQDIDILIYGMPGDLRLAAFDRLAHAKLSTVFVSGLYGEFRDNLIARSKLVLNINLYQTGQIFEIVRVSYLLANKKAVVATLDEKTFVEEDVKSCLKFTTHENLVVDCLELVQNEALRVNLENSGFEAFSQRDIRPILRNALG